jgi:signal transduction histidine kinase
MSSSPLSIFFGFNAMITSNACSINTLRCGLFFRQLVLELLFVLGIESEVLGALTLLFYLRLVGFAAGALLNLFLLALIIGHRRPRAFERALFFLLLALFFFYAGCLLSMNAHMEYAAPPPATLVFAMTLVGAGLALLPPLFVHVHVEYERLSRGGRWRGWQIGLVTVFYLPAAYFCAVVLPHLLGSPSLESLRPGSGAGVFYGLWLGSSLLAGTFFEFRAREQTAGLPNQSLHGALGVFFFVLAGLAFYTYGLGGPRNPAWSDGLATTVMLSALIPGVLFGYYVLRFNFLEIGVQRNLVYAVSLAFLALLYLAMVRRVSGWLQPVLPPEATAMMLLFVLVFAFEPLERGIGRALYRSFHSRMERLQRLTAELQGEAGYGELAHLIRFAEGRLREEFGLAEVRISIPREAAGQPLRPAGGLGHTFQAPLYQGREKMGLLEACSSGAVLTGETTAALEFLAEQLPAAVGLCRLIEEKLQLERELAERERLALLGQMAASISHNLRNPLSAMKTVLQVLMERTDLPAGVRDDCALVVGEVDRLGAKIAQLLQFARPSLSPAAEVQRVDATALAEQAVTLLARDAERRRVAIGFAHSTEGVSILGSPEAWNDVVSNLIVNAIEAQPGGGKVCVSLARSNGRLLLEVSDEGPGIGPELRSKVLQPFFTTKPTGAGLGLAIVARRLAELNGSIAWESPADNGKGTKFTVTIPLTDSEDD